MERVIIHLLFPIVLLMHVYHCADAQAGISSNPPLGFSLHDNLKASFSVMVVAFFSALVFMAIVSFYLRHCSQAYVATRNSIAAAANLCRRGVNRQVIDGCPILVYSAVKDLKISKGALECAVCLGEFQDYDRIRLLPKCHHVFHPDCIDAWLLSHMNCPVCRARLASADCGDNAVAMIPMLAENNNPTTRHIESGSSRHEIEQQRQQVVAAEPNNQRMDEEQSNAVTGSEEVAAAEAETVTVTALERNPHPSRTLEVFPRSHSTGHSLQLEPVEENLQLDRYTLRLPEHVRKQILANHNYRIWRSNSSDGALPGAWSSKIACYRRDNNMEQLRLSMTPPFVPRSWGWGSVDN